MSLLEQIKLATLELRKVKHPLAALGQTVIGEAEMIGKNDGNRQVTDSEVMSRVKKFLTGVDDTIKLVKHPEALAGLQAEKAWLEGWLPKQFTEEQLQQVLGSIKTEITAGPKDMGKMLQLLKSRFDGQYDGKLAATVAKALLS
jgi:uncharacterized protein YqeY